MPSNEFYDQLSLVLVGGGFPLTSPTAYDALCFGVPFINPVAKWDPADPTNRDKWAVQHEMLKHLDPPYVLERMKMHNIEQRLGKLLATD
ncbi:hypothetical protein DFH09DRAFT_1304868 [Mycena vulgaris]|nr:hypothetical protein DFH09DRAFT_1304868 [Mycena vulgaris]